MKCNWLKSVSFLNLSDTFITNNGVQTLARGNWKKLTWLNLSNNNLSFVSSNMLSQINFKNIEKLRLN
jgi:Leucine-rich repeat (LRR) protein